MSTPSPTTPGIKTYRALTDEDKQAMNDMKVLEEEVLQAIDNLRAKLVAYNPNDVDDAHRVKEAEPLRWLSIGKTHIQEGFMALNRAIAQPTRVK